MGSLLVIIIGLPLFVFVLFGPMYCVVKIAKFKRRNSPLWTPLAIIASIPTFIVISLLPSLRPDNEKEQYAAKFTPQYDSIGYILTAVFSVLFIGAYYFRLQSQPDIPSMQNMWFHIHFILLFLAFSGVITSFILSIVRLMKNSLFPRVILKLQLFVVISLFLCIIAGAIWAEMSWGKYWTWDPKETWSLIFLSTIVAIHTYFLLSVPKKGYQLMATIVQMGVAIFLVFGVSILLKGLWPSLF